MRSFGPLRKDVYLYSGTGKRLLRGINACDGREFKASAVFYVGDDLR